METTTELSSWQERLWTIGTITNAKAGNRYYGVIEHGSFADGTLLQSPVHLIVGAHEGTILYVQAAIHGDEINGVDVLRRVVTGLNPANMHGALIAVPVTNGPGFVQHQRRNPYDEEDMNRVWPGKAGGMISQQIVFNLYEQAVRPAQYVIDLHTASSTTMLHTVYSAGDETSRKMAEVFALEVLLEEAVSEDLKQARFSGKLRNVLTASGVGAITPELGGDGRFEEANIQKGVRGVTNIMKYLGMLEGEILPPDNAQVTVRGSHLDKVRANHGGIFQAEVKPGDRVSEGQALGYIYSVRSFEVVERFVAPYNGFILGLNDVPVVNVGDPLVNICPI
jgi:uncharacterized protein